MRAVPGDFDSTRERPIDSAMNSRFQIRFGSQIDARSTGRDRLRWGGQAAAPRLPAPAGLRSPGPYPKGTRAEAVTHCVAGVAAGILDLPVTRISPDVALGRLGADDLDVEEIVDTCEEIMGLPRESVLDQVEMRPSLLTVRRLSRLLVAAKRSCRLRP